MSQIQEYVHQNSIEVARSLYSGPRKSIAVYFSLAGLVIGCGVYLFATNVELAFAKVILFLLLAPIVALIPFYKKVFQGRTTSQLCESITANMNQTSEFKSALYKTLINSPWSKCQMGFGHQNTVEKTGIAVWSTSHLPIAYLDFSDDLTTIRVTMAHSGYVPYQH